MLITDHEKFMKEAIDQALVAYRNNDVPIGAVVVKDDVVISRGYNRSLERGNSLAHAEIEAINSAMKNLSSSRLNGCSLYVTAEPCIMCAGAILHARIDRVYFGVREPKFGGVVSIANIFDIQKSNHKVEWLSSIMSEEISEMMKTFFKNLRLNC